MLLCMVEWQKEDCLLVQELRQKTFNMLIFFNIRAEGNPVVIKDLAKVWKGKQKRS